MIFIYNLAIRFYVGAIRLSSFFGNQKAKRWLEGRRDWRGKTADMVKPGEKRIWFHCSSLGEFEQGRPVMEQVKASEPAIKIVLTFFSPSGYEVRKNYGGADYVFYLPADTKSNAKDFIELISPQKVFFTKYEYWHHYFSELHKRRIPLYMISAVFRPADRFFSWYGGFFRKMLKCVTHFFVQDDQSQMLLHTIAISNSTVAGDTRFDRVVELPGQAKDIPLANQFRDEKHVLVAGSTWPPDEKIIYGALKAVNRKLKLIIAPHEISETRLKEIETVFLGFKVVRYSMSSGKDLTQYDVLLIDNIGMLSSLYRYGNCAYIGGGFGAGIHNTLEAAVYGIPVVFGPNFGKFIEAKELINCGGAFSVSTADELTSQMQTIFNNEIENQKSGKAAGDYVRAGAGATKKIMNMVFSKNC